jgi:membrane protease YdiL (CAAX protease family)
MTPPTHAPQRSIGAARSAAALCVLGTALGLGTCSLATESAANDAVALGIASLGLEIFLACVALGLALLSPLSLRARLGLGRGRLSCAALALLVLGTLALSQALDGLIEVLGLHQQSALAEFESTLAGASGWPLALALVGVGLAPGIGEELLCRGLVQRGLEPRLGRLPAILIAALFFGALHLETVHAVFAGILGLYLGVVAVLAGSTRAAILCHSVNNLAAVLYAARFPELTRPGVAGIALGLALAAGCLLAARRAVPETSPPPLPTQKPSADGPI